MNVEIDKNTEKYLLDFIDQYMPLNEEEKKAIIDLNIFRSFKKGSILLKEGEIIKGGHLIIKGCLRCYYIIDGEERTTAFYTEAEALTPVSESDTPKSTHYVSCIEDSIVTVHNPEMINDMHEKFPRFEKLCMIMAGQLLEKNLHSFATFKNSSPEQRYLDLLKNRPDLIQRVPQHQIASYLGIKPQSLTRIRKRISQKSSL